MPSSAVNEMRQMALIRPAIFVLLNSLETGYRSANPARPRTTLAWPRWTHPGIRAQRSQTGTGD